MKVPYVILEVANVHGGDKGKVFELIRTLESVEFEGLGIKFQPFRYDQIALPDYSYYDIYKGLFFDEATWREILPFAAKTVGDVWLDLFDRYGVSILKEHIDTVRGIKLQSSVLDNYEVISALFRLDLSRKHLILNVSGYQITDIERFIQRFSDLAPEKLILQVGFQGYPTRIEETSLNKVAVLRAAFPGRDICFADHLSAEDPFAQRIPLLAPMAGCSYIEKHVCLKRSEARYDYYSALELEEIKKVLEDFRKLAMCFSERFVTDCERDYLAKSIQTPVLAYHIKKGQLIAPQDLLFRRTDQDGLTLRDISERQEGFHILESDLEELATVKTQHFKRANIAVIVAGRMKSSRLKRKAVLPIRGIASVERCLQNCLMFPYVKHVILATSTLEEDSVLKDYTLGGRVKFWQGEPHDVISRYLGACDVYGIDVVIRVTADCPVVSPEIAEYLLKAHFASGADYTGANECAAGTAIEVYNVEALKRVIHYLGKAEYSEYMTWYMRNNRDIFKVNIVDLPTDLVRDYRLTLDYQEDLNMLNRLFEKLEAEQLAPTARNVFRILDENPGISLINSHLTLLYKTDKVLIEKLNRVTRISIADKDSARERGL